MKEQVCPIYRANRMNKKLSLLFLALLLLFLFATFHDVWVIRPNLVDNVLVIVLLGTLLWRW